MAPLYPESVRKALATRIRAAMHRPDVQAKLHNPRTKRKALELRISELEELVVRIQNAATTPSPLPSVHVEESPAPLRESRQSRKEDSVPKELEVSFQHARDFLTGECGADTVQYEQGNEFVAAWSEFEGLAPEDLARFIQDIPNVRATVVRVDGAEGRKTAKVYFTIERRLRVVRRKVSGRVVRARR